MTEHKMIMLGVLNEKKCHPLTSFARHWWVKKTFEDCGPIMGKKKIKKKPFTVLHLARLSLSASHPQH